MFFKDTLFVLDTASLYRRFCDIGSEKGLKLDEKGNAGRY
jgi:hypothetical protein